MKDVIVIGLGPAGITASLYILRAKLSVLGIEKFAFGGQINLTYRIENYPGFPDGISGYELAELFKKQIDNYGLEVVTSEVDPKTHRDGWLVDYEALHINHNRFQEFLHKNAQEMKKVLGYKFELLMVAYNLLRFFGPSPEEKTQFQERFVELFSEYQKEIWKRILRERGIVP